MVLRQPPSDPGLNIGYVLRTVQGGAGFRPSTVLTSIFLWCLVHKLKCKAAAPTGIAAANVEIPKTDVSATTLHAMFEFDGEYKTRMDFAKLTNQKVQALLQMQVLLLVLEKEIARPAPHCELFYDIHVLVHAPFDRLPQQLPGRSFHDRYGLLWWSHGGAQRDRPLATTNRTLQR
jgi:hypothetical protein